LSDFIIQVIINKLQTIDCKMCNCKKIEQYDIHSSNEVDDYGYFCDFTCSCEDVEFLGGKIFVSQQQKKPTIAMLETINENDDGDDLAIKKQPNNAVFLRGGFIGTVSVIYCALIAFFKQYCV